MAGWLWDHAVPDEIEDAAKGTEESRTATKDLGPGSERWDDPEFVASEEARERRQAVRDELAKLGGEDGLKGLPRYRLTNGQEVDLIESSVESDSTEDSLDAFKDSPLLSDSSVTRYLVKSVGDAAAAAQAMLATLEWRQRVMPDCDVSNSRPAELLREEVRFRRLGSNAKGDLVFALDCLFGHFLDEETSLVDCLRMCILGVEEAVKAADACGHPKVVLIIFGGPPPVLFSKVAARFLQDHYPERLQRAVIYPVPSVWASIVSACIMFLQRPTRSKIGIATGEAEAVEQASLTGPEQLPESWRGGVDRVGEVHNVDTVLLSGITMEYLSPFGEWSDATEAALSERWLATN